MAKVIELRLDVSKTTKSIEVEDYLRLGRMSLNGIVVESINKKTPCPWDAVFEVDGETIVLYGCVDACDFGKVKIILPKNKTYEYYDITIEALSLELSIEIKEMLLKYGITVEMI